MPTKEISPEGLLKSILNGIESIICVCDSETFDILFLNDSIRNLFGIKGDGVGQKCYKLLQKLDSPCPVCPYQRLREEPDKSIIWEHKEVVKGRLLRKTAKLIDWSDGRKAHLEYAVDITELRQTQETVVNLESKAEKIYFDQLTGIYNRRYFDEKIENVISGLSRSGVMLSLLMVDIDFFKKYNDTYGHIKGDECLKIVAEILQNSTARKNDFVVRYGGEEFVVVLPNTNENGALLIAERMLENVWSANIEHKAHDDEKRITVSIGVTSGEVKQSSKAESFIRRADEMLYESKRTGRNKLTFSRL